MWFIKVGSRVTGPFNEDEMRNKRLCKELAPFHLVSRDAIRWESAAQLIKLLDGAQPEWKQAPPPMPSREMRTDSREGLTPVATIQWYYVDASRNQLGPISQEVLCDLLRTKQIRGQALVCKAGETQWGQAKVQPELASAVPKTNKKVYAIAGSSALGLMAIIGVFLFIRSQPEVEADPAVADKPSILRRNKDQLLITSLSDEEKLSQAVGLVGICERTIFPNGRSLEELMGTGSCFAITPDGYLITNRHVAIHFSEMGPKKLKLPDGSVQDVVMGNPIVVFFRKVRFEAKVIWISKRFDLAILKVERPGPHPYFALGIPAKIPQETLVAALGYPGAGKKPRNQEEVVSLKAKRDAAFKSSKFIGIETELLDRAYNFSATRGYIDRLTSDADGGACIEHGARIMHGNSGGPLALKNGVVVGLNTAGMNETEKSQIVIGTGKDQQVVEFEDNTESIHISYTFAQFRDEISEYIPSGVIWKEKGVFDP